MGRAPGRRRTHQTPARVARGVRLGVHRRSRPGPSPLRQAAGGALGLDPPDHSALQAHREVGERPERNDAPARLVIAQRILGILAIGGAAGAARRRRPGRGLVGEGEAAGRGGRQDRDAGEGEGEQGRAGAAGQARDRLRGSQQRVARHSAKSRRQWPARRWGQGARNRGRRARADDPQREPQRQAPEVMPPQQPPAPQGQRRDQREGAEAEHLHGEVGRNRARPPQQVANRRIGRVVEAGVGDRPCGERRRQPSGQSGQAQANQLKSPPREKGAGRLGEVIEGRGGTADGAHERRPEDSGRITRDAKRAR